MHYAHNQLTCNVVMPTATCSHVSSSHSKSILLINKQCHLLQLTVDVAWSPACIDKRCYDYTSLADIADFIFIMAYDERSQVFGRCIAWANSPLNMTLWGTFLFVSFHILFLSTLCCQSC